MTTIESLKRKKSPILGKITSEILISNNVIVSEPLTHPFNTILKSVFPKAFIMGIVKPVYKWESKNEIIKCLPSTLSFRKKCEAENGRFLQM